MITKITLGHLEAHEKLTARLYFKPAGDTGYLDAVAGVLTVLPSGTILAQDDLTVTFGCATITHQVFTGQDHPLFRGDVRILETNQHSQGPLREIAFTGVMYVTAWPEQSGEIGKYTAHVTPTTKPVIKRRSAT